MSEFNTGKYSVENDIKLPITLQFLAKKFFLSVLDFSFPSFSILKLKSGVGVNSIVYG